MSLGLHTQPKRQEAAPLNWVLYALEDSVLTDDGDAIRALGYVVIYSTRLESEVGKLLEGLERITGEGNSERLGFKKKVRRCIELLPEHFDQTEEAVLLMNDCIDSLEKRNDFVHGEIVGGLGNSTDRLFRNGTQSEFKSSEVYSLANAIDELTISVHTINLRHGY